MPQNNPPYVTPTTIVDEIKVNEVMINQYTVKVAEINAAIAVLVAENVLLFQPSYPPEISRLSELAWRKSAEGYCIAVNRDLGS